MKPLRNPNSCIYYIEALECTRTNPGQTTGNSTHSEGLLEFSVQFRAKCPSIIIIHLFIKVQSASHAVQNNNVLQLVYKADFSVMYFG